MGKDVSEDFATTGKWQLKLNLQLSLENWSSVQILCPFSLLIFYEKKYKLAKHNETKHNIESIHIFFI